MRKMLDGELQTPWTPEDEREFRALFTRGLGGHAVRSEEASRGPGGGEDDAVRRRPNLETATMKEAELACRRVCVRHRGRG